MSKGSDMKQFYGSTENSNARRKIKKKYDSLRENLGERQKCVMFPWIPNVYMGWTV